MCYNDRCGMLHIPVPYLLSPASLFSAPDPPPQPAAAQSRTAGTQRLPHRPAAAANTTTNPPLPSLQDTPARKTHMHHPHPDPHHPQHWFPQRLQTRSRHRPRAVSHGAAHPSHPSVEQHQAAAWLLRASTTTGHHHNQSRQPVTPLPEWRHSQPPQATLPNSMVA